ncbi:ribbon-helix-helix domain-containing protein [Sphingomonas sp. 8AM]|uniref:ribbon-helix-helix domain-containing protein n=1 Tax=Sphingomonas sp. 8AM TaxID=2653170 RepID=UPI0012F1FE2A|nr:ribbon-helix-helix domain-containing protein [Sphingomonas sp. 8AM]VXC64999.1 Arylsulfate sulfotransferase [Sphingomonas sp. 8AM]
MIAPPRGGFVGPVKRSVTIAGHSTSVSLEPVFWSALERAAVAHALPLSALVAEVDALRIAEPDPPNLASALRTFLANEPVHFGQILQSNRINVDSESQSQ